VRELYSSIYPEASQAGIENEEAMAAMVVAKLEFAQNAFVNAQELNRTTDAKANYLLSAVALLTAALGIVAANAFDAQPADFWQGALKVLGILCALLYLLVAFNIIYIATKVFRAVSRTIRPNTTAPGMIFPLMLLERSTVDGKADEDLYMQTLIRASPRDILHDYANQLIEVSNIYKTKQAQVNLCIQRFRRLSVLWVVTMLVLAGIVLWYG
jgi:hypothetical protein